MFGGSDISDNDVDDSVTDDSIFTNVGCRQSFVTSVDNVIISIAQVEPQSRAHYVASVYAARLMVPNGSGLIVNMSSSGGIMHMASAAYGIGKAAKDRMAQDFNSCAFFFLYARTFFWPVYWQGEFRLIKPIELVCKG